MYVCVYVCMYVCVRVYVFMYDAVLVVVDDQFDGRFRLHVWLHEHDAAGDT